MTKGDELVERLRNVVRWLMQSRLLGHEATSLDAASSVNEAIDALSSAQERIAELEGALEPFADVDGEGNEDMPDNTPAVVKVGRSTYYALDLEDFRRASKTLHRPCTPTALP